MSSPSAAASSPSISSATATATATQTVTASPNHYQNDHKTTEVKAKRKSDEDPKRNSNKKAKKVVTTPPRPTYELTVDEAEVVGKFLKWVTEIAEHDETYGVSHTADYSASELTNDEFIDPLMRAFEEAIAKSGSSNSDRLKQVHGFIQSWKE